MQIYLTMIETKAGESKEQEELKKNEVERDREKEVTKWQKETEKQEEEYWEEKKNKKRQRDDLKGKEKDDLTNFENFEELEEQQIRWPEKAKKNHFFLKFS